MSNLKIIAPDGVTPSSDISQIVDMIDAIMRAVQDQTNAHMKAVYEIERQRAEIDRLKAELAAVREDTERLEFLISEGLIVYLGGANAYTWHVKFPNYPPRGTGDTPRAAIDAARKERIYERTYNEARKAACNWCRDGNGVHLTPPQMAHVPACTAPTLEAWAEQQAARVATLTQQLLNRNSELAGALLALKLAERALEEHNAWHCEIGFATFALEDGKDTVTLDLSDAYSDSALHEKTQAALAAIRAAKGE